MPQEFKAIITIIIFQTEAIKLIKAIFVLLTNPESYSLYLEDSCMYEKVTCRKCPISFYLLDLCISFYLLDSYLNWSASLSQTKWTLSELKCYFSQRAMQ